MGPATVSRRTTGPTSAEDADGEARERQRLEREAAAAEFFAGLPEGSLTEAEEELRRLLLEAVTESGSVRLSIVAQRQDVKQAKVDLGLPKTVSLSQWINARLADDLSLLPNRRAGDNLLTLPGTMVDTGSAPDIAQSDELEEFYAGLPSDSFTDGELTLRDVILRALERSNGRSRISALTRGPGEHTRELQQARAAALPKGAPLVEWLEQRMGAEVTISEAPGGGTFVELVAGSSAGSRGAARGGAPVGAAAPMTPPWAPDQASKGSARTGAYARLSTANGARATQPETAAADRARPSSDRRFAEKSRLASEWASAQPPDPEAEARREEARLEKEARMKEFIETLPDDNLTDEEQALRQALLDALRQESKAHGNPQVRFSMLCQKREVIQAKAALLPADIPIGFWVEHRIGGELAFSKDANGQLYAVDISDQFEAQSRDLRKQAPVAASEVEDAIQEPVEEDGEVWLRRRFQGPMSPEEKRLRDALVTTCGGNGGTPRSLSGLLVADPALRAAWQAAQATWPREVALSRWVELRLSGQVQLTWEPYVSLVRPKRPFQEPAGGPPAKRSATAQAVKAPVGEGTAYRPTRGGAAGPTRSHLVGGKAAPKKAIGAKR